MRSYHRICNLKPSRATRKFWAGVIVSMAMAHLQQSHAVTASICEENNWISRAPACILHGK